MTASDTTRPDTTVALRHDALRKLLTRIFEANGCSPRVAAILGANVARAEATGSFSHGIFRIEGYVSSLRSGWVDGTAEPKLEHPAPAILRVDAANGFAQAALAAARAEFADMIRSNGIAFLAIRDSHHFAALWPDVEPFADEGLLAISMVNSMTCSIPAGATRPVFGTNPIAFAAPVAGKGPLVFDFATTAMAHGDVQLAARAGRAVPPGTGYDRHGAPTTDPRAILDGGALAPFGGHKGSALSLMIELMCAGLSGGSFSSEFTWAAHPGAQTPRTGQILIGIDPAHAGGAAFADRAAQLMEHLADAGLSAYPGARRHALAVDDATVLNLAPAALARLHDLAEGRA